MIRPPAGSRTTRHKGSIRTGKKFRMVRHSSHTYMIPRHRWRPCCFKDVDSVRGVIRHHIHPTIALMTLVMMVVRVIIAVNMMVTTPQKVTRIHNIRPKQLPLRSLQLLCLAAAVTTTAHHVHVMHVVMCLCLCLYSRAALQQLQCGGTERFQSSFHMMSRRPRWARLAACVPAVTERVG